MRCANAIEIDVLNCATCSGYSIHNIAQYYSVVCAVASADNSGTMGDGLEFSRVPPHRFQDVIYHLRQSFFADEPLNRSLSLCQPGEPHAELEAYSINVLSQDMSTMVTSGPNQEVVGACLVGCSTKDTISKEYGDTKLQKIFQFIGDAVHDLDYGTNVSLNEIVDLKILSVDDRMRGRGLAGKLYQQCEQIARDKGYKMMRAEATALFSQKILERYGWETLREIRYSDYPTPDNPMFEVAHPHETFKVMVKRFN